ncbi:unnamed protein product [Trichobilharzia regenti]|nr:unnamed protein product [Trichobilharzia regenti]
MKPYRNFMYLNGSAVDCFRSPVYTNINSSTLTMPKSPVISKDSKYFPNFIKRNKSVNQSSRYNGKYNGDNNYSNSDNNSFHK